MRDHSVMACSVTLSWLYSFPHLSLRCLYSPIQEPTEAGLSTPWAPAYTTQVPIYACSPVPQLWAFFHQLSASQLCLPGYIKRYLSVLCPPVGRSDAAFGHICLPTPCSHLHLALPNSSVQVFSCHTVSSVTTAQCKLIISFSQSSWFEKVNHLLPRVRGECRATYSNIYLFYLMAKTFLTLSLF